MRHKKLFIIVIALLLLVTIAQYVLAGNAAAVSFYSAYIFNPFQYVRNSVTRIIPFSLGDILYVLLGIVIISLVIKWIYYLVKLKVYRKQLLLSLFRAGMAGGIIYIWFFIGWGGNYHKPSLAEHWGLEMGQGLADDSALIKFDLMLVEKLAEYAPHMRERSFAENEKECHEAYRSFPPTQNKLSAIKIKPALYGNLLEYSAIQGYYNPFTGEGQLNANIPYFIRPFVICHEMAHQCGVAAEDDANFLAFVVCTETKKPEFIYSAYFNLWLYTNGKLRGRDTALANTIRESLNPVSREHLEILRAIRRKYSSRISKFTGTFYDNFLKLNSQEKGLESYDDVVNTAYAWEQRKRLHSGSPVSLP